MKHLPTAQEITDLSNAVARDGIAAHHAELNNLAATVRSSRLHRPAAEVLSDDDATDLHKARAFMVIARNWSQISAEFTRWAAIRRSFAALAAQWEEHRQLRSSPNASLADLYNSRVALDMMRAETALTRVPR